MRSSECSTCNMPLISSERAGWEKSNSGYRHRVLERLNDSAKVTQLKAVGLGLGSSFCPFVLPCCLPGGRTEAGSGEVGIVGLCLTASFSHTLPQKQRVCPECHLCRVVTLLVFRRHEWPSTWWHTRQLRPCSNSSDHYSVSPHFEWKWFLSPTSLTWPYSVVCILTKRAFLFSKGRVYTLGSSSALETVSCYTPNSFSEIPASFCLPQSSALIPASSSLPVPFSPDGVLMQMKA